MLNVTNNQEPLYLGRSCEEWLEEFISDAYVEETDDILKALLTRFGWEVADDFGKVFSMDNEDNFNLICHALSCFDEGLLKKATKSLPRIESRKQVRIVFCMGRMGPAATDYLIQLLKNSSATLRAAACLGIIEAFSPGLPEGAEESPAALQLMVDFLEGPALSPEELDAFFEKLDALQGSEERKPIVNAEAVATLVERLKDDYESVRLAAIHTLGVLLRACTVETASKKIMLTGLLQRLEDEHQAVRIAAMEKLDLLEISKTRVKLDDAILYDTLIQMKNHAAHEKAVVELAYNGAWEHLQKLLNDPGSTIHERVLKILTSCKTEERIHHLGQLETWDLIRILKNADPVSGRSTMVREEAVYALQGLSERWKYPEDNRNENQKQKQCEVKTAFSWSMMRSEIHRLIEAPFQEVIVALHDRDVGLRIAAVEALLTIQRNDCGIVHYVHERTDDRCRQVRLRAQRVLRRMVKDKSGAPERHYG